MNGKNDIKAVKQAGTEGLSALPFQPGLKLVGLMPAAACLYPVAGEGMR